MTKLDKLYNILIHYYSNIILGVTEFRSHMSANILSININTNVTMDTTASTLNKEYKNILSKTKDFDVSYINNTESSPYYEYKHETEHMINKASATFTGIKEHSEFKYETYLLGDLFKTPYVKARIVDKTIPDKLFLQVRTEYGFCGRTSFRYDVDFNDANYTLTLDYDTKNNIINITTYTDFEKYFYTSQMYQIPEKFDLECIEYFGYEVCFMKQCYNKTSRILSKIYTNEVPAKNINETLIIVG